MTDTRFEFVAALLRRLLPLIAAVAVLGSAAAPVAGQTLDQLAPEEAGTLRDLVSLTMALEAFHQDHAAYPGPTAGYVPVESIRTDLSPSYMNGFPPADGWGHAFLYWSDSTRIAIVSLGSDGTADRLYEGPVPAPEGETPGDDLVWQDDRLWIRPPQVGAVVDRGAQLRTMADLRSLGIALEAYHQDHGTYPGPTEGIVPTEFLRESVQPAYIVQLPVADGWSGPLLYWSDGSRYLIVSNGRDGAADGPYDDVPAGTTTERFDSDIIFGNGVFVQRPEGEQH